MGENWGELSLQNRIRMKPKQNQLEVSFENENFALQEVHERSHKQELAAPMSYRSRNLKFPQIGREDGQGSIGNQQNRKIGQKRNVSFNNPITSLGTSFASGSTRHSLSAIKISAGASAVTVLSDLKQELEEERDRLSSLLGVQPNLRAPRIESIIANSHHKKIARSWLGTSEQRGLDTWLNLLISSMDRNIGNGTKTHDRLHSSHVTSWQQTHRNHNQRSSGDQMKQLPALSTYISLR